MVARPRAKATAERRMVFLEEGGSLLYIFPYVPDHAFFWSRLTMPFFDSGGAFSGSPGARWRRLPTFVESPYLIGSGSFYPTYLSSVGDWYVAMP